MYETWPFLVFDLFDRVKIKASPFHFRLVVIQTVNQAADHICPPTEPFRLWGRSLKMAESKSRISAHFKITFERLKGN